jgi:hypothetical protein
LKGKGRGLIEVLVRWKDRRKPQKFSVADATAFPECYELNNLLCAAGINVFNKYQFTILRGIRIKKNFKISHTGHFAHNFRDLQ